MLADDTHDAAFPFAEPRRRAHALCDARDAEVPTYRGVHAARVWETRAAFVMAVETFLQSKTTESKGDRAEFEGVKQAFQRFWDATYPGTRPIRPPWVFGWARGNVSAGMLRNLGFAVGYLDPFNWASSLKIQIQNIGIWAGADPESQEWLDVDRHVAFAHCFLIFIRAAGKQVVTDAGTGTETKHMATSYEKTCQDDATGDMVTREKLITDWIAVVCGDNAPDKRLATFKYQAFFRNAMGTVWVVDVPEEPFGITKANAKWLLGLNIEKRTKTLHFESKSFSDAAP